MDTRTIAIAQLRKDAAIPEDFDYGKSEPGSQTVIGARTPKKNPLELGPLSEAVIDAIKNEALILYVHGKVTYKDQFNKIHSLLFCVRYDPNQVESKWIICSTHNRAD